MNEIDYQDTIFDTILLGQAVEQAGVNGQNALDGMETGLKDLEIQAPITGEALWTALTPTPAVIQSLDELDSKLNNILQAEKSLRGLAPFTPPPPPSRRAPASCLLYTSPSPRD